MTFTEPAVLWALPLGLLPLLLHLLSRRRAALREFSDLTLLRRVQAQALPRARLRQWLLAAARGAVIGLLVAAYAGPVLSSPGGGQDGAALGEGLDLVLLMDRSASMGLVERGRARWSAARDAAGELLRSLRPADRVACADFTDRLEPAAEGLGWTTPRACLDLISRAAPLSRGTDYGPPLRAAYALLAGSARDKAVVLLSDGAAHGARAEVPTPEPGTGLYCLAWPPPPPNAAVLAAGPDRAATADKPVLRSVLWSSARQDSSWDLWEGGARLGGSPVSLAARAETVSSLPLPSRPQGRTPSWSGRAESRPDALRLDDALFYSFELPRRPRLLVLYGDPAFLRSPRAGSFLQDLFSGPGRRLLDWDADSASADRLGTAGARLADYDAVALADCAPVGPAAAASLELFVRAGGGLWLFPPGRGDARGCLSLGRWLPVSVSAADEPETARGLRVEAGGPFAAWQEFELDKVALTRRLDLSRPRAGRSGCAPRREPPCWPRPATAPAAWPSGGPGSTRSPATSRSSRPSRRWSPPPSRCCASRAAGRRSSRSRRESPSSGPGPPGSPPRRACACAPPRAG
ncbi:MAG: BatA domain-containing protein [Elusimicrobia bacterium]|nr:BatA domain-containing protein [Elusimicrobiota bacterium]